ncbi:hypothetical protein RHMOL_Rhmol05G0061100 [Rhododendron molle]|uniref:Uncharacterized protein n=1 Tax=Rhododendron molle TaxID=49168 RepID=A0ACC0NMJ2_RHOML|nr:hypothetical protein RHMOL_Rhmol05G0061100 [Rhododendron molle]
MAMVQAESDFQLAVKMVNEGPSPTALSSNPACECRAMVDEIGSSPHTLGEGGAVADKLAKMGVDQDHMGVTCDSSRNFSV